MALDRTTLATWHPDRTPSHHNGIPGTQPHAQTFQDHAEPTSFNLNCGGHGQRGARTDIKYMEDRQAHARVEWGGGLDTINLFQRGRKETSASTYL